MANESVDNFFEGTTGRDNKLVLGGSMETATGQNLKTRFVTFPVGDLSIAGTNFIKPGLAGTIVKISGLTSPVTDANSIVSLLIGATSLGGGAGEGALTFLAASPEGTLVEKVITADNVVATDSIIRATRSIPSTASSNAIITLEILLS